MPANSPRMPFQRKVIPDGRQLVGQRDGVQQVAAQAITQNVGQARQHVLRQRRILHHQRADGVQAVEQEMRVELLLQPAQLRLSVRKLQTRYLPGAEPPAGYELKPPAGGGRGGPMPPQ